MRAFACVSVRRLCVCVCVCVCARAACVYMQSMNVCVVCICMCAHMPYLCFYGLPACIKMLRFLVCASNGCEGFVSRALPLLQRPHLCNGCGTDALDGWPLGVLVGALCTPWQVPC